MTKLYVTQMKMDLIATLYAQGFKVYNDKTNHGVEIHNEKDKSMD